MCAKTIARCLRDFENRKWKFSVLRNIYREGLSREQVAEAIARRLREFECLSTLDTPPKIRRWYGELSPVTRIVLHRLSSRAGLPVGEVNWWPATLVFDGTGYTVHGWKKRGRTRRGRPKEYRRAFLVRSVVGVLRKATVLSLNKCFDVSAEIFQACGIAPPPKSKEWSFETVRKIYYRG